MPTIASVISVPFASDLAPLPVGDGNSVAVAAAGGVANDGLGGTYVFDALSVAADDPVNFTVVEPVPFVVTGRWLKRNPSGAGGPTGTTFTLPSGQSDYDVAGLSPPVVTTASGSVGYTTVGPKRAVITSGSLGASTKLAVTVRRPNTTDAGEPGVVWVVNVVALDAGTATLLLVPLGFGGEDLDNLPDESLTVHLYYG